MKTFNMSSETVKFSGLARKTPKAQIFTPNEYLQTVYPQFKINVGCTY